MIIHDLDEKMAGRISSGSLKSDYEAALKHDTNIVSEDGSIHNCIGCFGCWVKTPGICVINDKYSNMGRLLSKTSELLIISECCYGGLSPFVKNIFDRSISYVHPYFEKRNGEMHHKLRYPNSISLKVIFYGEDITEQEKETAVSLMKANSINLNCNLTEVKFMTTKELMEDCLC